MQLFVPVILILLLSEKEKIKKLGGIGVKNLLFNEGPFFF